MTFFSFFFPTSSPSSSALSPFLSRLRNDALRPASGRSGGALAAEAEHSSFSYCCCFCLIVVPAAEEQEQGSEEGAEDGDEKLGRCNDCRCRIVVLVLLSAPGPRRPGRPALGLEGRDQGRVP